MQEQYPHRKYSRAHTVLYRKRRRRRDDRKAIMFMAFIAITVAFVSLFLILHFSNSNNNNKLVGTWVYDEYTQYVFEESGHGKLLADDISYEYTYKIKGEKVIIDFTEDVIRDCDYTFSVDGTELTLKGGTGTDGGTYMLNKK